MGIDKEVVSYKISEMDVVKYMKVDVSNGNVRKKVLNNIDAVNNLLRESEKIMPIINYCNKK
jgi:hypothetical protein